jgi:hypothetical protein
MMGKIYTYVIYHCQECDNRSMNGKNCVPEHREIGLLSTSFPEWCPLEIDKAPEPKEGEPNEVEIVLADDSPGVLAGGGSCIVALNGVIYTIRLERYPVGWADKEGEKG